MGTVTITFRGQEREVEYKDYGYESDTNAQVIEWAFVGLTPEQHDALKVTDDEEQAIFETLSQNSYETAGDDW